jgi:hypothetical protein
MGLGDIIALVLSSVGVTKKRVQDMLGVADCGCHQRQQSLNELPGRVRQRLRGVGVRLRHSQPFIRCAQFWKLQRMAWLALFGR